MSISLSCCRLPRTGRRRELDAVEAAHEKGIVHRDLKPGKVKSRATEQPLTGVVSWTAGLTSR
jgi:hypothetical protein